MRREGREADTQRAGGTDSVRVRETVRETDVQTDGKTVQEGAGERGRERPTDGERERQMHSERDGDNARGCRRD